MDARARSVSAGNEYSRGVCGGRCQAWFREASGFGSWRRICGSAIHSSIPEQGLMAEARELLRKVPVFEGIPDDQIDWFLSQSEEIHYKKGDTYIRQGAPADAMFVLLEGEFQVRGEVAGEPVVFTQNAGDVSGILPFSRMKTFTFNGRANTDARLLRFAAGQFPELVYKLPELATRLVGKMSDRIREITRFEQQRDRLA